MARFKQRVNVNLPPALVEKGRNIGLNFSIILENALNDFFVRLEQPNQQTEQSIMGSAMVPRVRSGREFTGKNHILK